MDSLVDFLLQDIRPRHMALIDRSVKLSYAELKNEIDSFAKQLEQIGCSQGDSVVVLTANTVANVVAMLAVAHMGGVFIPLNEKLPLHSQVGIIKDCEARILVSSEMSSRAKDILSFFEARSVIWNSGQHPLGWVVSKVDSSRSRSDYPTSRRPDVSAVFYTSGSTGKAKGIVLSPDNLSVGASSVNEYLGNCPTDVILAVLPISFDAGFSQVSTGLLAGSTVVLQNYLLANDTAKIADEYQVTAITAVPPLWNLIAKANWSRSAQTRLRYFASTGGNMPPATLHKLRQLFPNASPFLMYGLTEAFRGTYLPPDMIDQKQGSIGIPIPNCEILVMRDEGHQCDVGEPGELVQVGPLVAQGYLNNVGESYAKFRQAPDCATLGGKSVWSGDIVRCDEDGYLYFEGRRDGMMKIDGHRLSAEMIEATLLDLRFIDDCCVFEDSWSDLNPVVHALVVYSDQHKTTSSAEKEITASNPIYLALSALHETMASHCIPKYVSVADAIPRDVNGKIDRPECVRVAKEYAVG